jgi:alpha-glucosidase
MLSLYRSALRIRRLDAQLGDGPLTWLPSPDGVLAFARGPEFACVTNLSPAAIELPVDGEVLLASTRLENGRLPADASAWIRIDPKARPEAGPSTREAA